VKFFQNFDIEQAPAEEVRKLQLQSTFFFFLASNMLGTQSPVVASPNAGE